MPELTAEQAFQQAQRLLNAGNYAHASGLSNQLIQNFADHAPVQMLHGIVLGRLGRTHEAIGFLDAAIDLLDKNRPLDDDPQKKGGHNLNTFTAQLERARLLIDLGRIDDASAQLDQVGEHARGLSILAAVRAKIAMLRGDAQRAAELIGEHLQAEQIDAEIALMALALARLDPPAIEPALAIDKAVSVTTRVGLNSATLTNLLRGIGDLHDQLGHHDDAFAAWRRAAGFSRSVFDTREFVKEVNTILSTWQADGMAKVQRGCIDDESPVLLVGVPGHIIDRVAELLAAHPAVAIAGRLTTIDWLVETVYKGNETKNMRLIAKPALIRGKQNDTAGEMYTSRLRSRANNENTPRLIDTNALNELHLGVVAMMCPAARIVRVSAPALTAHLDCFAHTSGFDAPFADDPVSLSAFIHGENRLAQHWRAIFADERVGMQWHELEWEAFARDPLASARSLVAFLGLEWDDAVGRAALEMAARPLPDPANHDRNLTDVKATLGPLLETD